MTPEILTVSPSGKPNYVSVMLGFACELLSKSPTHATFNIQHIGRILIPAIRHRQLNVLFDQDGKAIAYLVWATLMEDVETRFAEEKEIRLHESEWNEGKSLWIIDLVVIPGYMLAVKKYLSDLAFPEINNFRYMRKCRGTLKLFEMRRQKDKVGTGLNADIYNAIEDKLDG